MNKDILDLIPQPEGTDRILLPLDIPTPLNTDEAAKTFAKRWCLWTETIKETNPETGEMIDVPNPVSARLSIALFYKEDMKKKQIDLAGELGAENGRLQEVERVTKLFK